MRVAHAGQFSIFYKSEVSRVWGVPLYTVLAIARKTCLKKFSLLHNYHNFHFFELILLFLHALLNGLENPRSLAFDIKSSMEAKRRQVERISIISMILAP